MSSSSSDKASLTDRLSALNIFKKSRQDRRGSSADGDSDAEEAPEQGDEDAGQKLTDQTVAGGGRGTCGRGNLEERRHLRVSHGLQRFLVEQGELQVGDVTDPDDQGFSQASTALQEILAREPTIPPAYVTDRTHPLSSYLMSSSHNSYISNSSQLRGKVSAQRYTQILDSGMRCVEIDCWDGDDDPSEPKVTHGLTLTQSLSFRSVIEAIGAVMDKEITAAQQAGTALPLPIFISLENHCGPEGQVALVKIMRELLGPKLLVEPLDPDGRQPKLEQLEGRICCMVEHYASGETDDPNSVGDKGGQGKDGKKVKPPKIVPELASLGVYANSIKPTGDAWLKEELRDPANPLLNIGEGPLLECIEKGHSQAVIRHNTKALQRVYPAGTRITSKNLLPPPFWGVGSHIVALNAQTFDCAMQLNEAAFDGTDGFVLKPAYLRMEDGQAPAPRPTGMTRLTMTVAGASDLPLPGGRKAEDIKPYVTCTLYHPLLLCGGGKGTGEGGMEDDDEEKKPKRKTSVYRGHKLSAPFHSHDSPPGHSPLWHHPEDLIWTYPKDELVFLRILLKSDDSFARNPVFAATAVKIQSIQTGKWVFLRLFNLRGELTHGSLCVKFAVEELG